MVKILIIEDSAFERKIIKDILKKYGYTEVIESFDGYEGVKKFKEERPDLVLLDLRLPGMMNGFDVFKEIKKIYPSVKCIIISILRTEEAIDQALKLGAKYYIPKPVMEDKLILFVKKIIAVKED